MLPKLQIARKLLPIVTKPKRFKVIIGGRGGGKSIAVADALIMKAQTENAPIMCLREYQNSISDSVHSILKAEINRMGVSGVTTTDSKIDFDGDGYFRYKGMSRDTAAIKSAHGFKYSWVEEAQTITQKSIDDLLPTIREDGSECWFTANPQSKADPFSKEFINPYYKELLKHGYYEDDMLMIIVVNWRDNPWFPEVLNQQRINNEKRWAKAKYDNIWEGAFNDSVENSLIDQEWFEACIDAHLKLGFKAKGAKILSHDASDQGDDPAAYAIRHGSVITHVKSYDHKDLNDNGDEAFEAAIINNVDVFNFDADGVGVGLRKPASEAFKGKSIKVEMFKGSWGVDDPDGQFDDYDGEFRNDEILTNINIIKNCRAQYYWDLRSRCYLTWRAVTKNERMIDEEKLISFSSDIDNIEALQSQLCRIPRKHNPNGMIQVMTKQEMWAKHQIESPNESDAVMMTLRYIQLDDWAPLDYGPSDIV